MSAVRADLLQVCLPKLTGVLQLCCETAKAAKPAMTSAKDAFIFDTMRYFKRGRFDNKMRETEALLYVTAEMLHLYIPLMHSLTM